MKDCYISHEWTKVWFLFICSRFITHFDDESITIVMRIQLSVHVELFWTFSVFCRIQILYPAKNVSSLRVYFGSMNFFSTSQHHLCLLLFPMKFRCSISHETRKKSLFFSICPVFCVVHCAKFFCRLFHLLLCVAVFLIKKNTF